MRRARLQALLVLLAAAALPAIGYAEELVYLRTEQGLSGQGWLFNRGGRCYALTPKHVFEQPDTGRIENTARAIVAQAGATRKIEARADRCVSFPDPLDLSLVEIKGIENIALCGKPLAGPGDIDALLATTSEASLLSVTQDGGFKRYNLTVRAAMGGDIDHFWVGPAGDEDLLYQGLSGGHVTLQNRTAGFLLSGADPRAIKVLRMDRAFQQATRYFDNPASATAGGSCGASGSAGGPAPVSSRSAGRVSAACGARIVSWLTPAADESSGPENIVGGSGLWRSTLADGQSRLELRLCGPAGPVRQVSLDTSACPVGSNTDVDVEVMTRARDGSALTSLGYAGMSATGQTVIARGTPLTAQSLVIRLASRNGKPDGAICVGQVQVN